jgi:hypothetical protein
MAKAAKKKPYTRKAAVRKAAKKSISTKIAKVIETHELPAAVKDAEPFQGRGAPLVEMRDVSIAFGGIKAVDHASIDLNPGEVVGPQWCWQIHAD